MINTNDAIKICRIMLESKPKTVTSVDNVISQVQILPDAANISFDYVKETLIEDIDLYNRVKLFLKNTK